MPVIRQAAGQFGAQRSGGRVYCALTSISVSELVVYDSDRTKSLRRVISPTPHETAPEAKVDAVTWGWRGSLVGLPRAARVHWTLLP